MRRKSTASSPSFEAGAMVRSRRRRERLAALTPRTRASAASLRPSSAAARSVARVRTAAVGAGWAVFRAGRMRSFN